ncbi:MAG: 3-hydroxybutyryl-CoA dehydrogenase [Sediminibacterium sp.]|nr:3-hydroxybutyryl-CoA dehydrogenase [Sediminibacterium sp.]
MDHMKGIQTICVCGAGTMGSGIAQVAAMAGFTTIQFDVDPAMLEKSRAAIEKNLQWLSAKGKISAQEQKAGLSRIHFTTSIGDCIADLVIEAIIEKKEAKTGLFRQLALINSSETIFATNTSSIAITEIAAALDHPGKVIGMHFFNPAPVMKLVEVVKAQQTEEHTVRTIADLSVKMGKTPVVCHDAPGFIVNRVARHYYLEAMKLVEDGLATIETVDAVLEASGFKMGPFKLMDLIGMDINFGVSHIVWEALGKPERLTPSVLQQQKVTAGDLGRKTGKGFYKY